MANKISQEKHHKHPPLARPKIGHYHRCEWGIYGTSCAAIEAFFKDFEASLNGKLRLLFVDAEHGEKRANTKLQIREKQFNISEGTGWNEYDDKLQYFATDAAFVNGNHYPASRQMVFLNPKKRDSLKRRSAQLTNIQILIKEDAEQQIFDFLEEKITAETQIFTRTELPRVYSLLQNQIQQAKPPLKALILAGGKSQRMGEDKSQLVYHAGKSQELYIAQMCQDLGLDVYLSKAYDFEADTVNGIPVIKDRLLQMGPFGAILSAMMQEPDTAWLVLACDLPFLNQDLLQKLIQQRNAGLFATAVKSAAKPFPEPLVTIYEPRAYLRLLSFLSLGYACPRKVLINSDIHILELKDDKVIENVNTPEERVAVLKKLNN